MGDTLLEEPLPPPQLDDGVPPILPPRERHGPNVNFMRIPPMLKKGHDISLFLRRFEGYADASHVHGEIESILYYPSWTTVLYLRSSVILRIQ